MLINGDLIRIPQGTVILQSQPDPVPLTVAQRPQVGIVIDNELNKEELIKVLLDDEIFLVDKRVVQLIRGST